MPSASHSLLNYLRVWVGAWRDDPRDDAALLAQFAEGGDEAAFRVLVCRHGPLVWQTCRRMLGDTPDAEDAFQVVFLALARQAGRLRREPLAGWLHRVARRATMDVQIGARRRRGLEQRLRAVKQPEVEEGDASRSDLYAALDEELACLPERLRVPLLLHYLEGRSQVEVARLLGCGRSVLQRRLARGEAILRQRLEQRGLTVGVGSVAVLLGGTAGASAMPALLIGNTVRAALRSLSFPPPFESSVSAALAEGVLKTMLETKMKIVAVLLGVTLCLAGGGLLAYQALAGNAAESPQPASEPRGEAEASSQPGATARVDYHGDPLPAHALARMGTVRQWYGRLETVLAFSPDDKTLVSQNCERQDGSVCLWDAATGREIRWMANAGTGTARWRSENTLLALSPDGQTLAKVQSGATGKEGSVYLWEVATGKLLHQLKRSQEPRREACFRGITFLPDGKILTLDEARNSDNRIYLWDVATGGREISQLNGRRKGTNIDFQTLAFSRDGKMVAATDEGANDQIQLWEVATGKKIHQLQLTGEYARVCSVVFSPDVKTLAAGSSGSREICVWKAATGKLVHQLKGEGRWSFCPLAYSPDGKTLVGGCKGHLWDVATGKEIRLFGWEHAKVAVFSSNGKILAVGDEAGVIRLWEVATGKEILPHKGHHDCVLSIAYSPDGKTLASVSRDQTVRLWEVATGKEIRQLAKHARWGRGSLTYSPDGKILASVEADVIHLWDTATGKEIRQLKVWFPKSATFSPDGKFLAAMVAPTNALNFYHVCLWQVATGKQICTLSTERSGSGGPWSVAFSPDGRMLAVPVEDGTVDLREVASDKSLGHLGGLKRPAQRGDEVVARFLAFSPDGRMLATSSKGDDKVHLWEVTSGKEIWQLAGLKNNREGYTLAFSPDGRMLATAAQGNNPVNGSIDPRVHLWEVANGKEIGQLSGHRAEVRTIAFSPDGKTLASCSDDLTCLVWDVTSAGRLKPGPAPPFVPQALSKERLEAAWADLAKDPAQAYAAVRALQAAPTQAIALLQARVRPVAPRADPQQLHRWIADLDADNFAVREKAQREIGKLGEAAIAALQQAMKGQPALGVKRRLQALLAELEPKVVSGSPRRMRELRAVQVLESIGTAEARQILQAWAKGVAEARLTREAESALARLAKRSAVGP